MNINIPTWITLFRVITIPFIIIFFYLPFSFCPLLSAIFFIFASLTDWFDGFLARRLEQTTVFGAFLDPVVDKLLVAVALMLIEEYFHTWWVTLPVASMIMREIVISALREWVAKISYPNVGIIVSRTSKIKTTLQMFSVVLLLWHPSEYLIVVGTVILYLAFVLTLLSILKYVCILYKNGLFKRTDNGS
ncbi:CDP-diacylglycerol--glycerol-3-phosphate 3-phosphatidyltransferase [Blochmannia endosymbiont of Polyrhachis (Hedomyrma) turneri]|nr:CDP-diacylglycerol--glycerol-3-phosphate 3-phosphatidyltransferase [Blochmannia endosymbiont of Polyrhachis (Hedomyrma) turneri]